MLAILWPEADVDRARPLFSDSLYMVRSSLGEDAIIATGDELRLNGERVSSDVEAFDRLLGEEQYERAIAEYAGPFLDGFHVADTAEFERWVDGERGRLAERIAVRLMRALQAAGNRPAALQHARVHATLLREG